jgi:hypothetical protein
VKDLRGRVLDVASQQMRQEKPFVRLFEVSLPTYPETKLRLANYDRPITFQNTSLGEPIVWSPFAVALGDHRESRDGDIASLSVSISNVTLEFMGWVDAYVGLTDQRVRIFTVHTNALDDVDARILYEGSVASCEVDQGVAVFTLSSPSVMREVFPSSRWLSQCGVDEFGDARCGYAVPASPTNSVGGGFDFCPRSLVACRERGEDEVARGLLRKHPLRFDGAPGLDREAF